MDNNIFAPHPKDNEPWDVAIIGSGPAGLTAGIYTTRGAASTLILAGEKWGGQLMLTTEVDNFPGFPKGIMGPELMENMRQQVERFGAKVVNEYATKFNFSSTPFEITTSNATYKAKSIILATGAETKWLDVPGEERLIGRGVSSCAPCDAPFFKNKTVAVVGGGDSAMEEALVLAKYASHVTILHRRNEFRASQAMQQKVLNNPQISVMWNVAVVEIKGEQKVESIVLEDVQTHESREEKFDGIFVAIGHEPASKVFGEEIALDEKGYILKKPTDQFAFVTNKQGVFVAGDVHDHHYRQAVTAAGFGCMAALECLRYLDGIVL
jgi:thioredoxin reductase (NADPH)